MKRRKRKTSPYLRVYDLVDELKTSCEYKRLELQSSGWGFEFRHIFRTDQGSATLEKGANKGWKVGWAKKGASRWSSRTVPNLVAAAERIRAALALEQTEAA